MIYQLLDTITLFKKHESLSVDNHEFIKDDELFCILY